MPVRKKATAASVSSLDRAAYDELQNMLREAGLSQMPPLPDDAGTAPRPDADRGRGVMTPELAAMLAEAEQDAQRREALERSGREAPVARPERPSPATSAPAPAPMPAKSPKPRTRGHGPLYDEDDWP